METTLAITIKPKMSRSRKVLVELNAEKFERLAGIFGFFSAEFLESLKRAEKDCREGRIRKIKSLKQMR